MIEINIQGTHLLKECNGIVTQCAHHYSRSQFDRIVTLSVNVKRGNE